MSYRHWCPRCGTTSHPVLTRSRAEAERRQHRDEFHGGRDPVGERIIKLEPFRLCDVPRNQLVFGLCAVVVLVIATFVRFG